MDKDCLECDRILDCNEPTSWRCPCLHNDIRMAEPKIQTRIARPRAKACPDCSWMCPQISEPYCGPPIKCSPKQMETYVRLWFFYLKIIWNKDALKIDIYIFDHQCLICNTQHTPNRFLLSLSRCYSPELLLLIKNTNQPFFIKRFQQTNYQFLLSQR